MPSATVIEMHALETQLDVEKRGWLDSLPMDTGNIGINARGNLPDMYQKEIEQMATSGRYDLVRRFVLNRQIYSFYKPEIVYHTRHLIQEKAATLFLQLPFPIFLIYQIFIQLFTP